jgi:L-ascorbate metabolism protein UlaG (beta-lactamase superfamily)
MSDDDATASNSRCTLQFIGTATVLLRFGPFTVLTDPNFLHRGERAYLGYGLSSRRLTDPALEIDALPPLDVVVLSHMHGDHWDRKAKKGLDHAVPVVSTPQAARALRRQGFGKSAGLATWTSQVLTKDAQTLGITALPGRHARGVARHLLPPVMGSMIEYRPTPEHVALRLYISGDTLLVPDLRAITTRYPHPDVAVLHLGGTTLPGGLVVTMDAQEGADLVELVGPGTAVPVHYDDYTVFRSPLADFRAEVDRRGIGQLITYVERGQEVPLVSTSSHQT